MSRIQQRQKSAAISPIRSERSASVGSGTSSRYSERPLRLPEVRPAIARAEPPIQGEGPG